MFGYRRREQHLATMRSMRERADMECTTVKPGRPIRVFMDGCFDVMHFGHMNAFRRAKYAINGPEGTFLVVGVNTSASVETAKGTKPLMDDDERNRVLDLNGLHFHIGIMFKFVSLRQVETPLPQLPPQPKPRTTAEKKQKQKRAYRKGRQKVSEAVRKANAAKTKKDTGKSPEK